MAYLHTHTLYLNLGGTELPVEIKYTIEPGFAGDRIDPPYDASVCLLYTSPSPRD